MKMDLMNVYYFIKKEGCDEKEIGVRDVYYGNNFRHGNVGCSSCEDRRHFASNSLLVEQNLKLALSPYPITLMY